MTIATTDAGCVTINEFSVDCLKAITDKLNIMLEEMIKRIERKFFPCTKVRQLIVHPDIAVVDIDDRTITSQIMTLQPPEDEKDEIALLDHFTDFIQNFLSGRAHPERLSGEAEFVAIDSCNPSRGTYKKARVLSITIERRCK